MRWNSPNFVVDGTDRQIAFKDIVRTAYYPVKLPTGTIEAGLAEIASFEPAAMSFPNGCHICELDIDRDTGMVEIVRFTAVDDFGHIVNPMLVDGQLHGGIAQGIGQELLEGSVYDGSGQLVSGSFMDYAMPRAHHLSDFDLDFKNTPCRTNILGVQGCGKAGVVGAPPAVVNALINALMELGVKELDMPATPSKLWSMIHGKNNEYANDLVGVRTRRRPRASGYHFP